MAASQDNRSRAKAWAADLDAARRRAGFLLPDWLGARAEQFGRLLSEWALAEIAPGRLIPWLPVAFGVGIVGYFTADREPAVWAVTALALGGMTVAVAARRRPLGFALALAFAATAAGFALATLQSARLAHPVLAAETWRAQVSGFIETREERERSDRIVVRVETISAPGIAVLPDRVRVAVRKGTAPPVGAFVTFKAHLSPPLQPLRPGGYDFARDLYFQGIGASGYVLGAITTTPAPAAGGWWLNYAAAFDSLRDTMDNRIRAVLQGDRGAIASALITGKRDAISAPVNDAMYISSLAHVLSISGYHMAVVAGIVFFLIRALLALFPTLAARHPIKKWAAACALAAAYFYLLLSGSEVATQRSFIMIAIVLVGVMLDRPALTFRTLAAAAFAVLLLAPQSVVHPSFQMSFAATLALVAAYRNGFPWRPTADSSLGARVALWGGREIVALIIASTVAGLATTPYAAYHFHRVAPYGVLANLLAMPVVSAWVMPMGIIGAVIMPFGFDGIFWQMMGWGIDWMIVVVLWVTSLPGSVGHMHAFGVGPLLLATAGMLLLCLLRSPLRLGGAALAIIATLWALATPLPDVMVAGDGHTAAIRTADGRLTFLTGNRDTFAIKEWLAADGDDRGPKDKTLREGIVCDAAGCIGQFKDGRMASLALKTEAFAEDCTRAAVVISAREGQGDCAAALIDRKAWRAQGAIALRWHGDHFEKTVARPPGYDRPWGRATPAPQTAPVVPREATPAHEDLEAGD
jgi:competence protein ComEC